ncbi:ABC transporter ATP-binding protein [Candidatus Sumerlaeota bacterium]|nr:ABC transporter ATP-binding protein [Candidatus Sumerlaeota bacterium]
MTGSSEQASANKCLLEVQGVSKRFGGLRALDGVNCRVSEGRVSAIIGPNGAGKTTLFNCLTGVDRPTGGSIRFLDREIAGMASHRIAAAGIARTWQTIRLFEHMTVLENVLVGCHCRGRCGMLGAALRLPRHYREERRMRRAAMDRLDSLGIVELARLPVGALPFLQQRRVELARALVSEPRLLLLDEPAAGLNARETIELGELILQIRDSGVTVVLVEHDMSLVMEISERVFVLDHGTPIAEGTPREIQNNPQVIAVYLGVEA